ncbi:MAG TPA: HAMP domain-containing histidine kinase [Flavobacteriales bacterium]|nr:HAMP domain-containing histidine kinase [Flavobacteriales bacterium]HIA11853.1 HAMP domain-containing histidine kinase [Flavobacteriales bacterium]
MNKKFLNISIVMVSLALIGLILIQMYWIRHAISLKEQQFDQGVAEALSNVVKSLERREALSVVRGFGAQTVRFNQLAQLERKIDSMEGLSFISPPDANGKVMFDRSPGGNSKEHVRIEVRSDGNSDSMHMSFNSLAHSFFSGDAQQMIDFNIEINENAFKMSIDGFHQVSKKLRMDSFKMNRKLGMVKEIMREMVIVDIQGGTKDRVDPAIIDSMLEIELEQKGINLAFASGIFDSYDNAVVKMQNRDILPEISQSPYKVHLFPANVFSEPTFLSVFFPDKSKYLLKTMSGVLSLSIFITLAVILSFYYTVKTIYEQKRDSEIKTDFINNMTHELKTPISTISLAAEAIGDRGIKTSPERMSNYIKMIQDENKRLGKLVENVLQSAVLDKESFGLNRENMSASELVSKAVAKMEMQVLKKSGELKVDLANSDVTIYADQFHLTNAITNLIDNAVKYSPDAPQVILSAKKTKEGVVISCSDKGIGISKEDRKKIFEKLYRVPKGNIHNVKGFGLGLNYVQTVIEKHGGTIEVKSEINKGSTFEMFIPKTHG